MRRAAVSSATARSVTPVALWTLGPPSSSGVISSPRTDLTTPGPVRPKKVGPFVLQGLFLKRQQEVAKAYADQVESGILNPTNILEGILKSDSSDELFRIIQFHVADSIDKSAGIAKPFVQLVIGTRQFIAMKNRVCDRVMDEMPKHAHVLEKYTLETLDIRNTLQTKMQALDPEDFIGVIRPAFEQAPR